MMAIPIVYNLRNLWARKMSTLLTVGGVGLAVGVFVIVLMLVHGLKYALVESGSPQNVIVLRKGAPSETMTFWGEPDSTKAYLRPCTSIRTMTNTPTASPTPPMVSRVLTLRAQRLRRL